MTQEEQLLLQDLCARIPYSQIVNIDGEIKKLIAISNTFIHFTDLTDDDLDGVYDLDYCVVKPYLRPMSNMTEDEKIEYKQKQINYEFGYFDTYASIDWLNAHHFDYRRLIERGLALKAPKGMY